MKDYGLSITFAANDEYGVLRRQCEELKRARDACIDYHSAYSWHLAGHDVPEANCYFCSTMFKQYRFWSDVAFWQTTCEGCGKVMYECGQACELWYDY